MTRAAMMRKPEGTSRSIKLAGVMVSTLAVLALVVHSTAPKSGPSELLAKTRRHSAKLQQQLSEQRPESWTGLNPQGQPVVVQQNSGNMQHSPSPSGARKHVPRSMKQGAKLPSLNHKQQMSEQKPESWTGLNPQGQPVVVQQNSGNMQHSPSPSGARKHVPPSMKQGSKLPSLNQNQQTQESYTIYDPNGAGTRVNQHNSGNFIPGYGIPGLPDPSYVRSPSLYTYPQAQESWTIQDPSDTSRTRINQHNSGNFVPSLPAYPPQYSRVGQEVDLLVPVDMPLLDQQQPESYVVYGPTGYERVNQQNSGNYIPNAPVVYP